MAAINPFSLCEGFSKLSHEEREELLIKKNILNIDDFAILKKETSLNHQLAGSLIENLIGCFPFPLGIAVNFLIDDRDYFIPMVIEETSVVAACSKIAKWVRTEGALTTSNSGMRGLGQIQIAKVNDYANLQKQLTTHKDSLIQDANKAILSSMVARGGGVTDINCRSLFKDDGTEMAVIHVVINTCNAMGANLINQVCEYLKHPIEQLTGEKVSMCILSNLVDQGLTEAKIVIRDIDPELGEKIEEAYLFAKIDPYRAATNNKGIMNGIDAVLLATGNDWRAVEAGAHAYAARSGQYSSLSKWGMKGKDLHGSLEIPLAVGTVGGMTRIHPVAQICLKILGVESAQELARVVAAVGLIQNLAALKALISDGIVKGHMFLHIANIAIASGANSDELAGLKQQLEQRLLKHKRISQHDAEEILYEMRTNKLSAL
jgi:hydroxymethylglutaryl-CoA reductase